MKKLVLAIFCIALIFSNAFLYGGNKVFKLAYSKLQSGEINVYRILMRGVATNTNSFSSEKNEFENEIYITQLIREVNKDGNIIIQTNLDSVKSFINGTETAPQGAGAMFFTQMDPLGNVISSSDSEGNKNPYDKFQLSFPSRKLKIGSSWKKKVVIEHMGKEYPVHCRYKVTGFEKIKGIECVKIESVSTYKNSGHHSMKSKGVIYFNNRRSIVEKSVVSTFIRTESETIVGGIEAKNKYSMFLTVTMEHL